jgi:hypothetical protein
MASLEGVAARLFPEHAKDMNLDRMAHAAFVAADGDGPQTALQQRICAFLAKRGVRFGGTSGGADDGACAGSNDGADGDIGGGITARHLHAALESVFSELLELATNHARDCRRKRICPCDVRIPVAMHDPSLVAMFGRSHALWIE